MSASAVPGLALPQEQVRVQAVGKPAAVLVAWAHSPAGILEELVEGRRRVGSRLGLEVEVGIVVAVGVAVVVEAVVRRLEELVG